MSDTIQTTGCPSPTGCATGPRIGITERGDAGLSLDWVQRMDEVALAILITKSLNDRFLDAIRPFKDKIIVHVTCTGFGGKAVEPNVRPMAWTRERYDLLAAIVGPERTVLRVDPIIPTPKGVATAEGVLRLFADSGVKRLRWSLMDMYRHVADRFTAAELPHPYQGRFAPSTEDRARAQAMLDRWTDRYQLESCAESGGFGLGCISGKDTAAIGRPELALTGSIGQRKECLCPGNKTELLARPKRCGHQCLYCYWKD